VVAVDWVAEEWRTLAVAAAVLVGSLLLLLLLQLLPLLPPLPRYSQLRFFHSLALAPHQQEEEQDWDPQERQSPKTKIVDSRERSDRSSRRELKTVQSVKTTPLPPC